MLVQVTKEDKYENYMMKNIEEKLIGLMSPSVILKDIGRELEPGETLLYKLELCKED